MRDLQFWNDRLRKVTDKIQSLSVRLNTKEHHFSFYKKKLKTRYKCRLFYLYHAYPTFGKVERRRFIWFRNRIVLLTYIGKTKREIKRLNETKVSFYAAKIRELGGVPKDCFGNLIT